MNITRTASAGTVESCDIMVTIEPNRDNGIQIDLQSSVEKQFGEQIKEVLVKTLEKLDVNNVNVLAVDQGALDCTIEARTVVAVYRAADKKEFDWKELNSWSV
ncbi:citrate lyase acyl carrier protein [Fundicoccus culcitae]|uniref:Citrate lyase acyl carrier protein n=1 Tax=Fundicoccus culcitae TaxID=2969821 RepID=A0ABY5P399_9LACT|nr:citrate lyase acyl carrier protein [Fundicoccus culcitae]UUX33206.1 citrate lyase acyl carrier protein [Fundicoccus culcitae]